MQNQLDVPGEEVKGVGVVPRVGYVCVPIGSLVVIQEVVTVFAIIIERDRQLYCIACYSVLQ